ncbi:hypothetical protein [Massilia sp. 9096]|uniref:hypothetical protein n=1 Tax=Massilia sp. 9096 TaxID=1500894 RepID=UPI0012E086D6|nr:hypothetical protein [Massilia sp. 9096]
MVNDLIANLEKLIGEDVFRKGAAAFTAGEPRHAPARFGVYCGEWVRGYDHALYSAIPEAATAD